MPNPTCAVSRGAVENATRSAGVRSFSKPSIAAFICASLPGGNDSVSTTIRTVRLTLAPAAAEPRRPSASFVKNGAVMSPPARPRPARPPQRPRRPAAATFLSSRPVTVRALPPILIATSAGREVGDGLAVGADRGEIDRASGRRRPAGPGAAGRPGRRRLPGRRAASTARTVSTSSDTFSEFHAAKA